MKNIFTILSELEIEVPEDKKEAIESGLKENYITRAEFDKKLTKAETDRDTWKEKATTAEEALKGFEGVFGNLRESVRKKMGSGSSEITAGALGQV